MIRSGSQTTLATIAVSAGRSLLGRCAATTAGEARAVPRLSSPLADCVPQVLRRGHVRRLRSRAPASARSRQRAVLQRMLLVLRFSRYGQRAHAHAAACCCSRICYCCVCCTVSLSPFCNPPHVCLHSMSDGSAVDMVCPVTASGWQRTLLLLDINICLRSALLLVRFIGEEAAQRCCCCCLSTILSQGISHQAHTISQNCPTVTSHITT